MKNNNSFDSDAIKKNISGLLNKACCRQSIGEWNSLSLGFGEKKYHQNKRLHNEFYGEWELGTYSSNWRIIRNNRVLCGGRELVDSGSNLIEQLNDIQFGNIISLNNLSVFDIRMSFDCGASVDFLNLSSDEAEIFHIFGPNELYIEYLPHKGWNCSKSNL